MSDSVTTTTPTHWGHHASEDVLRSGVAVAHSALPALNWGTATDVGVSRQGGVNQDCVHAAYMAHGGLFAVADGMGGHAAGELAAQLGLDTFVKRLAEPRGPLLKQLCQAAEAANHAVRSQATGKRAGMGTTLVAAAVQYDHAMLVHIGDSRAYLLRDQRLFQLTDDHSWVAEQVRLGQLSHEAAASHRWRNLVNNALGGDPILRLEVFSVPLKPGDRLLLCSDGLHGPVSPVHLLGLLSLPYSPSRVARLLIDQANQNGGPDNVSAVVVDINEVQPSPRGMYWPPRSEHGPQPSHRLLSQLRPESSVQSLLLGATYVILLSFALLPLYRPVIGALGIAALLSLFLLYQRVRPADPEQAALRPEASVSLEQSEVANP